MPSSRSPESDCGRRTIVSLALTLTLPLVSRPWPASAAEAAPLLRQGSVAITLLALPPFLLR